MLVRGHFGPDPGPWYTRAMNVREHTPRTGDGWEIDVAQYWDPARLEPALSPVLLVPGYGMNAFVLGFHPGGPSMIEFLVQAGYEVWTANLRGQGKSRRTRKEAGRIGFRELALTDVPTALSTVRSYTASERSDIHGLGCSLGASILYIYLAHRDDHGLASMVSIGGPLRWDDVHPAVKLAFKSPRLAGALPIRGTRAGARMVLPVLKRMPGLLSIYMNASQVDLRSADQLVKTVENPSPRLNRQIARWVGEGDMTVAGKNITHALRGRRLPVLCVVANRDGIVPPAAVLSIRGPIPHAEVLRVGDDDIWFAHADLFVSRTAQKAVFGPLATWLRHA
jgi:alpha-beta hydrolase superfamily lysophospholipase